MFYFIRVYSTLVEYVKKKMNFLEKFFAALFFCCRESLNVGKTVIYSSFVRAGTCGFSLEFVWSLLKKCQKMG